MHEIRGEMSVVVEGLMGGVGVLTMKSQQDFYVTGSFCACEMLVMFIGSASLWIEGSRRPGWPKEIDGTY